MTGFDQGNGRQTAILLAERGANVVVNDLDGDVAEAVAFLAAPASDYLNGHELRVDGGQVPIGNWKHRYD